MVCKTPNLIPLPRRVPVSSHPLGENNGAKRSCQSSEWTCERRGRGDETTTCTAESARAPLHEASGGRGRCDGFLACWMKLLGPGRWEVDCKSGSYVCGYLVPGGERGPAHRRGVSSHVDYAISAGHTAALSNALDCVCPTVLPWQAALLTAMFL